MTDALYQLTDVRKRLGAFTLDIRSLGIQSGEVLALLGPTGAGKTTLLRLLAGLLSADEGAVCLAGQSLSEATLTISTRRRMTLVHQRPLLLTGSVRFNVEYPLRLRGERNCAARVDGILNGLRLSDIANQSAHTLSGGQTQLVAIARALVFEPEVLLLDEPTAHLDPAHVALVEEMIQNIQQQRALTIVWATHNMFQARRVANRTALLLNGQLVEVAPTETFFDDPRDSRTGDFVQGRMVY